MARSGQHHNDAVNPSKPRGHEKSRGRNHPDRTQPITTGPSKKRETTKKQAQQHEDPHKQPAQVSFHPWNDDIRESPTNQGSPRARESDLDRGRSGTDSNASRG
jgi:hypothetical protein